MGLVILGIMALCGASMKSMGIVAIVFGVLHIIANLVKYNNFIRKNL